MTRVSMSPSIGSPMRLAFSMPDWIDWNSVSAIRTSEYSRVVAAVMSVVTPWRTESVPERVCSTTATPACARVSLKLRVMRW